MPTPMTIGGYGSAFAGALEPERNANGSIREDRPQDRAMKPLHKDGNGPFCRFRIELPKGVEGVYAFVVDGRVQYVGEAVDIRKTNNRKAVEDELITRHKPPWNRKGVGR